MGPDGGPASPPRFCRWRRQLTLTIVGSLAAGGWTACSDPLGPEQNALERARARWDAHGSQTYSFTFQRGCFCPPVITRPVLIEVMDGVVVAGSDPETGDPLDPPQGGFPTIDDLFDEIQEAIDREADQIQASYDQDFGHPVAVFVDWYTNAIDDEMSFQVTDYTEALTAQAKLPRAR